MKYKVNKQKLIDLLLAFEYKRYTKDGKYLGKFGLDIQEIYELSKYLVNNLDKTQ